MGKIADRVAKMRGCSLQQIVDEIARMEAGATDLFGVHIPKPMLDRYPADAFARFWSVYPNRVGKADALKAFDKAMDLVDFEELMQGLEEYRRKQDDRPWCNPGTWLRQQRWEDQPATVSTQPRSKTSELRNDLRNRIDSATGQGGFGAGPIRQLAHRQSVR